MSSTLARNSLPAAVDTSVPSPNQRWLIRSAEKSRLTWSGARHRPRLGRGVFLRRRLGRATSPCSVIRTATAFSLTPPPSSRSYAAVRGDLRRPVPPATPAEQRPDQARQSPPTGPAKRDIPVPPLVEPRRRDAQ